MRLKIAILFIVVSAFLTLFNYERAVLLQKLALVSTSTDNAETYPSIFAGVEFAVAEATGTTLSATTSAMSPITASTSSTTNRAPVISTPAPEVPTVSPTLFHSNLLGKGWQSNSWGISTSTNSEHTGVRVTYHKQWEAFSLYSESINTKPYRSIEITITSPETDPKTLVVLINNKKEKVGSVSLADYQVNRNASGLYRIPLIDIGSEKTFTDIAIESDSAQDIVLSDIKLSTTKGSTPIVIKSPEAVASDTSQAVAGTSTAGILPVIDATPALVPLVTLPEEPSLPLAPLAPGPNIYFNGLQNGWTTLTRRGAVIDDVVDVNQSVTGAAIKFHFDEPDGSLDFVHPRGFATKDYQSLHMSIYGGVTDHEWQQLYVTLYDEAGVKLGTTDVMKFSGNGTIRMQIWNDIYIPLRELNATDTVVSSIDIENVTVTKTLEANDHMWIDNVRFMNDASY